MNASSNGGNAKGSPPQGRTVLPRPRMPVLVGAMFVGVAAAYVGSVSRQLFLKPDTTVYLGLARSLVRGEGYTFNAAPYAKYPPVFPLLLAAVHGTVGEALRVPVMKVLVAVMGVGALGAAYGLVRGRAGVRVAAAVVLMTAASTWFWSHASAYLLAEVPYALFSLLALWLAERELRSGRLSVARWLGVGALAALAAYTHFVGVALGAALVAGILLAKVRGQARRRRAIAAALAGGVCLLAVGYWWVRGWGLAEMASYSGHLEEQALELDAAGEKLKQGLLDYTAAPLSLSHNQVRSGVAVVAFLLLVLPGLVEGFRRHRSCAEFYLCAHFLTTTLMGGETGHERYAVPVVPLLFYYGCLSLRGLTGWVASELEHRRRQRGEDSVLPARWPRYVVVGAMLLVVGYGITYRLRGKRGGRPFSAEARQEEAREQRAWEELAQWVQALPARPRLYAGSGGSWCIIHYFTQCPTAAAVHDDMPPREVLADIQAWKADYVVADTREKTRERLWPVLERYPACFPGVLRNRAWAAHREEWDEHGVWAVYRVDQAALAKALASPDEKRSRPPQP